MYTRAYVNNKPTNRVLYKEYYSYYTTYCEEKKRTRASLYILIKSSFVETASLNLLRG